MPALLTLHTLQRTLESQSSTQDQCLLSSPISSVQSSVLRKERCLYWNVCDHLQSRTSRRSSLHRLAPIKQTSRLSNAELETQQCHCKPFFEERKQTNKQTRYAASSVTGWDVPPSLLINPSHQLSQQSWNQARSTQKLQSIHCTHHQ